MKTNFETKRFLKKTVAAVCVISMLALGACAKSDNTAQTLEAGEITGKVTQIEDTTVTLALGTLTENGMQGGEDQPPMPQDSEQNGAAQTEQSGDAQGQPPEKPSGEQGAASGGGQNDSRQKPSGSAQTPPSNVQSGAQSDEQKPSENAQDDSADGNEQKPADNGQSADGQTPPELPNGGNVQQGSQPPQMGGTFEENGETETVDLADAAVTKGGEEADVADIEEGDILRVTIDEDGKAESAEICETDGGMMQQPQGGNGGSGGSVDQGTSANTIDSDREVDGESYSSDGDDENALRVDGATATLENVTVDKSGGESSNPENGDFYGVNAALLATNGATVTIKNATIASDAQNGNGVFSYGSGTTVNISDSTITTKKDNSGGIQTTGGGTTNAQNLTVETSGNSSAAIRSDRGGGTVNVDGGTYKTNGSNSPAVYSTATITVKNATLEATDSEALVIEGKNSITLEDCDVTGDMSDTNGASSSENVHNVMIYQSMSGDADVGESNFSMTGGSLTGKNGDMFYLTNTSAQITLENVTITNEDEDAALLRVCGNSGERGWGSAGSNGAQVTFTAIDQKLSGDIVVDTVSTLDLTLKDGSVFDGTINITENENGSTDEDHAVVTIESGAVWNLTGDCTITSLVNHGAINFNGHTITLADGTVLSD